MGLLITLIIGGVIGWLASIVMKTNAQMRMIANVVVGVAGAAIGNWLGAQLGIGGGYVVSVIGAIVLIAILKVLGVFK